IRPLGDAEVHIRTYHFVMPFHQIRPSRSESGLPMDAGHIWVPMDDYNCMVYNWMYSTTDAPLTDEDRRERGIGNGPDFVDQKTFRSKQNRTNNYGLDREVQKTESYTGIDGINQQDRALQESMGPIVDRSREHLGPADKAIIQARKLLREAVKADEAGKQPAGTGTSYYTVTAGEHVLAFVPLDREEKPHALQIVLGVVLELGAAADIFVLLVHPPAPERQPAEAAFEEADAQLGMAIHDAAADHRGDEPHGAPRMRGKPAEEDVVPEIESARKIGRRPGEAVMRNRQIVLDACVPDRLERGVVGRDVP